MYSDPEGNSIATIIIGTIIGAAIGFGSSIGKQLIDNGWDFSKLEWGQVVNRMIVGGALGFSFAMGVGFLGPVLAGTAVAGAMSAGTAYCISLGVSFAAGSIGYVLEESMCGRAPDFGKAMLNGALVSFEGTINYVFGGIVGSVGNVGTKGKPALKSLEWYGKFIFSQEFTFPIKYGIDLIRKKL